MAENYQEENLGTQQENQSEYLRIIDDLSTELNTLSHQVNMVQNEFLTDEIAKQFESSMKGLETQNDLLQAAIESLIEERQSIEQTLQIQNEDLKRRLCKQEEELYTLHQQIDQLQQKVQQPCAKCSSKLSKVEDGPTRGVMRRNTSRAEEEIQLLNHELRRKTNAIEGLKTENARLTEELTEMRRNQSKAKLLQRRNAEANSNDPELIAKLNAAEEKNTEQTKSLQKAAKEILCLSRENEAMRVNQELFSEERSLLKSELIALKENQASQVGVQQSLQEQLELTMTDLYVAKKSQYECKQSMERLEAQYRGELKRHKDFGDKYNDLVDDRNKLLREYQKVTEIEQEKTNEIVAFHAWKDEQIHREKETRKIIKLFEEHIKDLLENQQNLLNALTDMVDDNRILVQVMEQSSSLSRDASIGYAGLAPVSSTNPVSKIIENIRNTSRRLSQQRAILEEDARRCFSK